MSLNHVSKKYENWAVLIQQNRHNNNNNNLSELFFIFLTGLILFSFMIKENLVALY